MTEETEIWHQLRPILLELPLHEQRLVDEFRKSAFNYAVARGRWLFGDSAERAAMENGRSIAHDRFIDSCDALSRACGRLGFSQHWRANWGEGRSGEARRRLGDFACFVAYKVMLEAR